MEKMDKIISDWKENLNTETTKEMEKFTFDIEKYNEEQKKKKFRDTSCLVALCVASLLPMCQMEKWTDLFFTSLPFFAVTITTILVTRSNKRLKSLDLTLSPSEYQKEELKTLEREYHLLKKIGWFFIPMMTTFALFTIFYQSFEGWQKYGYPIMYTIAFFVMIFMFRWGIKGFQKDIDILKNQIDTSLF